MLPAMHGRTGQCFLPDDLIVELPENIEYSREPVTGRQLLELLVPLLECHVVLLSNAVTEWDWTKRPAWQAGCDFYWNGWAATLPLKIWKDQVVPRIAMAIWQQIELGISHFPQQVISFVRAPLPLGMEEAEEFTSGNISVRFVRAYDPVQDVMPMRFDVYYNLS